MDLADLKAIGKDLLRAVPQTLYSSERANALGVGAAGDRTYPVDRLAEEIILSGLKGLNEPLTIVSEEMGVMELNGGGLRVLADPVDGSKNAIAGIPFYGTSIAVAAGDTLADILFAYVINLANGDEFCAEAGSGAWLNGRRIHTQTDDFFSLISYEAQVPARDIPAILPLLSSSRKTRCLGATALDLAYLASGATSVFVTSSPSRSFDFAGGWLLVQEAGGVITDTSGARIENVRLDLSRSTSLLAAGNSRLHRAALVLLAKGKRDV